MASTRDTTSVVTVKMYTMEGCPACETAKDLLEKHGVNNIEEIRVDGNPSVLQKMVEMTGQRTVPQIFIGGKLVGGCDKLISLDGRGDLMERLRP